jgi:hypothetical protein
MGFIGAAELIAGFARFAAFFAGFFLAPSWPAASLLISS